MEKTRLVIIGSGPAGYTAAIYAARANLSPILYEGFYSGPAGGQLMTTTEVENYPGFPEGITGPMLMDGFRKQAERFGTKLLREDVKSVEKEGDKFVVKGSKIFSQADAVIIATGATAKRLDIPGARDGEFWQRGVSACAVCDGAMPLFKDKPLYVVGGGDTAVEEALFLTKYGSQVFIVHRRDELRASKVMAERAQKHEKITIIWDSEVIQASGEAVLSSLTIRNNKTGETKQHEAGGLFFGIGHTPNTGFLGGQLETDDQGYILCKERTLTSVEGMFAAGDVSDKQYRQAVTAAGSGCMAALDAERYLQGKDHQ